MCAAMSMVAVAGGKAAGLVTGSNPNKPQITSYAEINKADSHMGAKTHTVEKFTNGLAFDRGFNRKGNEVDDAGVVLGTFPETNLNYVDGKRTVRLSMYPAGKDDNTEKHAEKRGISYNGVLCFLVPAFYTDFIKFI